MSCNAPHLDRVFIQIGSLPIYWYGVIIACGVFIGLYLATREADRLGMKKDTIIDLIIIAIPIAIISARIYYVIFEWEQYAGRPITEMFAIWNGGIAIHGALIGSIITTIVYTKIKKVSFWKVVDIVAPSLILGQAIGRWGNFMNQEAHGGEISVDTYERIHQHLPDFIMNQMCIEGIYYHPTFLYESIWNLLVFSLLLILRKYNPLRGEIFLTYLLTYSVGRFFIEGLRTDSLYIIPGLRTAEMISIILVVGAIGVMIYRRKKGLADVHYDGKKIAKKKK